jgi:hypothetical protein
MDSQVMSTFGQSCSAVAIIVMGDGASVLKGDALLPVRLGRQMTKRLCDPIPIVWRS